MASSNSASSGPSLTSINYGGRLLVKYGLAFLVFLMVGRVLLNAFVAYWKAIHPEPPPPPTVGFGVLPPLFFPPQDTTDQPSAYVLEMPYGIQEITDRAKVFLVTKSSASLLADQKTKEIAAKYGFIFAPEVISDELYRFTKNAPLEMSLEMSPVDFSFSLRSNFLSRPDLLTTSGLLPEPFEAVDQVKKFAVTAGLLGDDIATSSGKVSFLRSIGGELKPALSLSDAHFLQVDLNRAPIDTLYKVYTSAGEQGVISAKLSAAFSGNSAVMEMDYYYRQVDYLNFETYPLRSARSAWNVVQSGQAFVVGGAGLKEAVVREVELAYYDSFTEQSYLQPIYVFKGDANFMALVSAIDPTFISRTSTEQTR